MNNALLWLCVIQTIVSAADEVSTHQAGAQNDAHYSATISCQLSELSQKIAAFSWDRPLVLDPPPWADSYGCDKYGSYVRIKNMNETFRPFYISTSIVQNVSDKTIWMCTTEAYPLQLSKIIGSENNHAIIKLDKKASSTASVSSITYQEMLEALNALNSPRISNTPGSGNAALSSSASSQSQSSSEKNASGLFFDILNRSEFLQILSQYHDSDILSIITRNRSKEFQFPSDILEDKFGLKGFIGNRHEMISSDGDNDVKRLCGGGDVYSRDVHDIRKVYEFPGHQRLFNTGFRLCVKEEMPSNFRIDAEKELPAEVAMRIVFSDCTSLRVLVITRLNNESNPSTSITKVYDLLQPPENHQIRLARTHALINAYAQVQSYPPKRIILQSMLTDYIVSALAHTNDIAGSDDRTRMQTNLWTHNEIVFSTDQK